MTVDLMKAPVWRCKTILAGESRGEWLPSLMLCPSTAQVRGQRVVAFGGRVKPHRSKINGRLDTTWPPSGNGLGTAVKTTLDGLMWPCWHLGPTAKVGRSRWNCKRQSDLLEEEKGNTVIPWQDAFERSQAKDYHEIITWRHIVVWMWIKTCGAILGVAASPLFKGLLWGRYQGLEPHPSTKRAFRQALPDSPMEALVRDLLAANPTVSEEQIRQFLQQRFREYDTSFRSPLTETTESGWEGRSGSLPVAARCHCGRCKIQFQVARGEKPIRCHCPSCRHFHSSSFAAYLSVESPDWRAAGLQVHPDSCKVLGQVKRFMCGHCYTKLGTEAIDSGRSYCCLGSVDDESIPDSLALEWQSSFEDWHQTSAVRWWHAQPSALCGVSRRTGLVKGACACGSCSFEALLLPGELQHCYCKLCRRLSGSVAQTWVPASLERFTWRSSEPSTLALLRTTGHGQRHFCRSCGSCLTIVYDSQPDCIWPAAGTLEDTQVVDQAMWYRVIHICCSMMQRWYKLPDDQLPRLKYAG